MSPPPSIVSNWRRLRELAVRMRAAASSGGESPPISSARSTSQGGFSAATAKLTAPGGQWAKGAVPGFTWTSSGESGLQWPEHS